MRKRILKALKKHRWFVVFFFLLAAFRGFLMTSGHQFWPDEGHYLRAFGVLEQLCQGHIKEAVSILFESRGRPGFVVLSLLPAAIQKLAGALGLSSSDLHYYDIPGFFNVLCSLGVTVFLYIILLRAIKDRPLALTGIIVYSLLVNTNVYLRHLLPYDMSLFLFILALWLALRLMENETVDLKCAGGAGLLAAAGFVSYPGYYLFVAIVFVAVFALARDKIRAVLAYFVSFAGVIGVFELLSHWAGTSFIRDSFILSTDINQGSFQEGYIFLGRYLIVVEGVIGVILALGFAVFVIFVLPRCRGVIKTIFLTVIAGYLFHAAMGVVFQKMVFYGRLMHMYFPFLVWGSVWALALAGRRSIRRRWFAGVLACAIISFVQFGWTYGQLHYPKDFTTRHLEIYPDQMIYRLSEHRPYHVDAARQFPVTAVNVDFLYPITAHTFPFIPSSNQKLLAAASHPVNFPAHGFEGYTIEERRRIREREYQMRVYARQR